MSHGPTLAGAGFLNRVSVVIPALNEEATVAEVVTSIATENPGEIIVIDADSTDATAQLARDAGARVVNWRDAAPGRKVATREGKGESLWRGVAEARNDFVVFVDADLVEPPAGLVRTLAQPLADDDNLALVKPIYQRGFRGANTGGGRVTELTAKPLLRIFFPELAHVAQPLGGEYAVRRSAALELPFVGGFGVEAGLLIDVARTFGVSAIAQVALGTRHHRNKPLHELSSMADIVAATIIHRAGVAPVRPAVHAEAQDSATPELADEHPTRVSERDSLQEYGIT